MNTRTAVALSLLLACTPCRLAAQDSAAAQTAPAATSAAAEHPALEWQQYPRWSCINAGSMRRDLDYVLDQGRTRLARLAAQDPAAVSWDASYGVLQEVEAAVKQVESFAYQTLAVQDTEESRAMWTAAAQDIAVFRATVHADAALWRVLQECRPNLEPAATQEQRYYMDQVAQEFRLNGIGLPEEKKQRRLQLETRLAELGELFEQNLQMAGPSRQGKEPDNGAVAAEILSLRQEMAELLGFRCFADMCAVRNMLGSGQQALEMVDSLISRLKPAYERDCRELAAYVQQEYGRPAESLSLSDLAFYMPYYRRDKCPPPPDVFPYLEINSVVHNMFRAAERLYGVRISTLPAGQAETWHPDVTVHEVRDAATGTLLGVFYMDLFPRAGKRSGTWMDTICNGAPLPGGGRKPNLAVIMAELSRARINGYTATEYQSAVNLYHEFGHVMHGLLAECSLQVHGANCSSVDFAELPSTLNEYWLRTPQGMAELLRHHETGEPLPQEYAERLLAAHRCLSAFEFMLRLMDAKLDLEAHTHYAELFRGKQLDTVSAGLLAPACAPAAPSAESQLRFIPHIMARGYAACYYSYPWAAVMAADVFSLFEQQGLFSPQAGAAYRRSILAPASSRPAAEMFRALMGHDPQPDSLFRRRAWLQPSK